MFVKKLKNLGPPRLTLTTITVRILNQGPESPEPAQEMKKEGRLRFAERKLEGEITFEVMTC
jgi:hypothetical protein